MKQEPIIKLQWQGNETVAAVPELLGRAGKIEITLPANYNHAIFRKLNPSAPDSEVEELDCSGGPELLAVFEDVPGLEKLSTLAGALTEANASLKLISPPVLIISLPASE